MKAIRIILWAMLGVVVLFAVTQLVQCRRHQGPLDGLYDRYSRCDGLSVALVRDKGIPCGPAAGDSLRVDLLMITADDSAAWRRLSDEFTIPEPLPAMQQRIDRGSDIVSVRRYEPAVPTGGENIRVASYLRRQVCIINAADTAAIAAVRHYQMEMNINETKTIQS